MHHCLFPFAASLLILMAGFDSVRLNAQSYALRPADSPVDNPLKGLVPYAHPTPDRFPHSMEFSYVGLKALMQGPDKFDWTALESMLDDIASRGNQAVFRVYLEYPGKTDGIPQYLIDGGLKVHRYKNTNTAPFPPTDVITPDYQDAQLRLAFRNFIAAFGTKYDGDPRLAYITAGLLGTWGEWHTYPRDDLWASKEVQAEVLDAYAQHFRKTPILLRYPAGPDHYAQTENASRPMGYHDDSFAWATLSTGKPDDDWFYMPALQAAGKQALEKWKHQPIGGEIRPEVWGKIFDDKSKWPKQAQDFNQCVSETHATWLMDTGMFENKASAKRLKTALREVGRMGYDFYVSQADFKLAPDFKSLEVKLAVRNQGVAPFYADWPTEVAILDSKKQIAHREQVASLGFQKLLPSDHPKTLSGVVQELPKQPETYTVLLRVVQPLPNGKPLRFANESQDKDLPGWLSLGEIVLGASPKP